MNKKERAAFEALHDFLHAFDRAMQHGIEGLESSYELSGMPLDVREYLEYQRTVAVHAERARDGIAVALGPESSAHVVEVHGQLRLPLDGEE